MDDQIADNRTLPNSPFQLRKTYIFAIQHIQTFRNILGHSYNFMVCYPTLRKSTKIIRGYSNPPEFTFQPRKKTYIFALQQYPKISQYSRAFLQFRGSPTLHSAEARRSAAVNRIADIQTLPYSTILMQKKHTFSHESATRLPRGRCSVDARIGLRH